MKYYGLIKVAGKTKWTSLKTTDREIASHNLKPELVKIKSTDPKKSTMTLAALLRLEHSHQIYSDAPSLKPGQKSKNLAAHRYLCSVNALTRGAMLCASGETNGRLIGAAGKSGGGPPHSKTLARSRGRWDGVEGLGMRLLFEGALRGRMVAGGSEMGEAQWGKAELWRRAMVGWLAGLGRRPFFLTVTGKWMQFGLS